MQSSNVLKQAKREMGAIVREIEFDNIEESRTYLIKYLDFLDSLKALPVIERTKPIKEESEHSFIYEESKPAPIPAPMVYTFERKLRGGIIPNLDGGTFVPERLIREFGYQHGDKLKIIKSEPRDEYVRHYYELVEKSATVEDAPNRVQLDYCIVKKDKHLGFIVEQYKNGEIKLDGMPHPFVISAQDAMEHNLQDGDLVDCAYYSNNLGTFKVIWRHEIEEPLKKTPVAKRSTRTKTKEEEDDEPNGSLDYEFLKGKSIVIVVGSEKMNHRYQQTCSKLGIDLSILSGDETYLRMESVIKKAQGVISVMPHIGHHGSDYANELSKEYDIPYTAAVRPGINHILVRIEEAMKKSERVAAGA